MGGATTTSSQASDRFAFEFGRASAPITKHRAILEGAEGGSAGLRKTAGRVRRLLDNEDVGVDHLCVGDSVDPFTCLFCKGEVTHGFDDMDRYQDPCSPNIDPLDPMEA